jgi:hypothetical protein
MSYHQARNDVVYQMLKCDSTIFNEEVGEMSFSVLARKLMSSPIRANVDDVNSHFMEIARDLSVDCKVFASLNGRYLCAESEEVKHTIVYFRALVADMEVGAWQHYSPDHFYGVKKRIALQHLRPLEAVAHCVGSRRRTPGSTKESRDADRQGLAGGRQAWLGCQCTT